MMKLGLCLIFAALLVYSLGQSQDPHPCSQVQDFRCSDTVEDPLCIYYISNSPNVTIVSNNSDGILSATYANECLAKVDLCQYAIEGVVETSRAPGKCPGEK